MNAALIPVRGGSKSIPLKNIKEMCGRPLVYWTVKAACECKYIDEVYVSTDSADIKRVVEGFVNERQTVKSDNSTDAENPTNIEKPSNIENPANTENPDIFNKVRVIGRSHETATDTASTESVMLEFAGKYSFDNIALIQATSPLLTGQDLDAGFEKFLGISIKPGDKKPDSVLSVVEQKRFCWYENEDGVAVPENYDVYNRPRRQDFEGFLVENGAFYIISKELLLKSGNRLSGNIGVVRMPEETYFEMDEPMDWLIAEGLLKKRISAETSENPIYTINNSEENLFQNVKMLVTDCDGCLTDGGMYYTENGDEIKKFNTKDGKGLMLLKEAGIKTAIITGEDRKLNKKRADKLKIDILKMGINDNKLDVLKEICKQENISLNEVVYIGDDLNDLECIEAAGIGVAVANAEEPVKAQADYITKVPGGSGAIREVANIILCKNDLI